MYLASARGASRLSSTPSSVSDRREPNHAFCLLQGCKSVIGLLPRPWKSTAMTSFGVITGWVERKERSKLRLRSSGSTPLPREYRYMCIFQAGKQQQTSLPCALVRTETIYPTRSARKRGVLLLSCNRRLSTGRVRRSLGYPYLWVHSAYSLRESTSL
jgi:hypothetical protein